MAYAAPNGFFGRDVSGENHPLFGTKRTAEQISHLVAINTGRVWTEDRHYLQSGENHPRFGKISPNLGYRWTEDQRAGVSVENHPNFGKTGPECLNYGYKWTEEQKVKISKEFLLLSPLGIVYNGINILQFCKDQLQDKSSRRR